MKLPRIVLIPAIAIVPVMPYAIGYGGQDFDFHLASWLDVRAAWHAGHLLPVWAAGANFYLGDPHLGFYPPIPMLLGALLATFCPITLAPAAFVWLALSLSGLAMYFASGRFVAEQDRLPAAALYIVSPYLLATALVRFAAGELLVQAWLPLILLTAYNVTREKPPARALPTLAALLGLTWLTNIPASIVLLYALTILACLLALRQRSSYPLTRILLAEGLALALAAFRLIPTWAERSFIHQNSLIGADPRKYLLFMPQARFPISMLMYVFWILFVVTFLLIFATLRKRSRPLAQDPPAITWALLATIAVFFQTPLAYPLWTWLPQLANVQHPFRFQPLEGAALPLLLFAPATFRALRRPVWIATLLLTSLPLLLFLSIRTAADLPLATRLADWKAQGYKGAPEYVPAHATQLLAPAPFVSVTTSNPRCILKPASVEHVVQTASPDACPIRFALFYYPYWQASDESGNVLATSFNSQGLLETTAPAGTHIITLKFRASSSLRTLSTLLSIITAIGFLAYFVLSGRFADGSFPDVAQSSTPHAI